MTTNNERANRIDRAARIIHTANELQLDTDAMFRVVNAALDTDTLDDPNRDALLALVSASFTSDDDYDDLRHELRVLAGPPYVLDIDADWEE